MNLEEQRRDDEKNQCVNKLVDICLSLMEHVIRLKELIEASSMERRRALVMPALPTYSYTIPLVEPFIHEIRRRQEQEEEEEEEEDTLHTHCRRVERADLTPPPFKRQKLL